MTAWLTCCRGALLRWRDRIVGALHPRPEGNIDLLFPRLVTGWMSCPRCRGATPELRLQWGNLDVAIHQRAPRPDTPTGVGFWVPLTAAVAMDPDAAARLSCSHHDQVVLTRESTERERTTQLLAKVHRGSLGEIAGRVWRVGTDCHCSHVAVVVDGVGSASLSLFDADPVGPAEYPLIDNPPLAFEGDLTLRLGVLLREEDTVRVLDPCAGDELWNSESSSWLPRSVSRWEPR